MEFEWDEEKRLLNIRKHGIDFIAAKEIWADDVFEKPSRSGHGEERFLAIGKADGVYITVVFTWRDGVRRLISARRARTNEKEDYENEAGRKTFRG